MSLPIDDYALIGDTHTCALVGRNGSIDWMCVPRFDSAACFAALLGTRDNGRWLLAPQVGCKAVERRYRDDTMILETVFTTETGRVALVDFMPIAGDADHEVDVVRLLQGLEGSVDVGMELVIRFGYGRVVPWVRRRPDGLEAIAGPDALRLITPVDFEGRDLRTCATVTVSAGETVPFRLVCFTSYGEPPRAADPQDLLAATEQYWRQWSSRSKVQGPWRDAVQRSLLTLKALTFAPSGGIVAAGTTSLPERVGGPRNWDYRYCWLRDATFTLYAFLLSGFKQEARIWRKWLLRAAGGTPAQLQIMYGIGGEHWLHEHEVPWLCGYENSRPVRIGNAAHQQFQLDVFGEVCDAFHVARANGLEPHDHAWNVERVLLEALERAWQEPDEGIWEVRGPRQHFTHSKVMAWVAFDRGVKAVERFGLAGPVDRWRHIRDAIRADILAKGFDPDRNAFVQAYGSKALDAALLMIPLVGFLPADDPRMRGTVEAIMRELTQDGFVLRYRTEEVADGLPAGEGTFLACSFWLADNLALMGRLDEAHALFERLLAVRNDVGLLAEQYDPTAGRMLGNFPQALSHIGLINTAENLSMMKGPARQRATG